jgi:D-alanyl-D-alanine carboxypeptidase/D-alanyl-D-alanine-endopeptidase (penicillin-binding protein 4)
LLANPALDQASWGVVARSLAGGDTLYQVGSRKLFVPASNMKIVTLAAAAARLGWDFTYETAVFANGPIEGDTLKGDLIVRGTGDPSIEDWNASPSNLFQLWAEQLKTRGLRGITGRVVGDDNAFDDEGLGAGWAWDDLDRSYATSVGALQFNQNSARLTITPGKAPGEPVPLLLSPDGPSGVALRSFLRTGTAADAVPITTRRLGGTSVLEIRGTVPAGGPPVVRLISVPNPTSYFVIAFGDALSHAGISSGDSPVDIDDLEFPPAVSPQPPLLTHRSAPLTTLAKTMMKDSQNLYAESLLKTLGARNGTGSAAAGREAEAALLREWALTAEDVIIADGSGLSRYNLVTPHALVTILERINQNAGLRDSFIASLPVAGVDGTLAARMRGTPAEGNARAKTGSLSNARGLSGFVRSADGEPLVFSILVNNFGPRPDIVEQTMDAIVVKLAEFRR